MDQEIGDWNQYTPVFAVHILQYAKVCLKMSQPFSIIKTVAPI